MGQLEKQRAEKSKSSRGSVNNASRLAGLAKEKREVTTADWGGANPAWITGLIVLLSRHRGAVRFGVSRDGGAYSVGVYLDDDSVTLWINGDADLDEGLAEIYHDLAARLGE